MQLVHPDFCHYKTYSFNFVHWHSVQISLKTQASLQWDENFPYPATVSESKPLCYIKVEINKSRWQKSPPCYPSVYCVLSQKTLIKSLHPPQMFNSRYLPQYLSVGEMWCQRVDAISHHHVDNETREVWPIETSALSSRQERESAWLYETRRGQDEISRDFH